MDWNLEVVAIPVPDVDRSKDFYAEKLGFNVDVDRVVPPWATDRAADPARVGGARSR